MANSICFISDYQRKSFHALGLFCLMLLMIQKGYARNFTVNWGLRNGTNAENYNQWAERNRFEIGDSLVFIYTPNEDSVLHVTDEAYKNCDVESPISNYTDGHTVFSLNHSGPYYFISGKKDNCEKNEKLVVVVLADRSNRSPPPSGSIEIIPSPAPSGESPPTGAGEINPTPSPSEESNPPNAAASSVFMTVTGSTGAIFVASTLLLA